MYGEDPSQAETGSFISVSGQLYNTAGGGRSSNSKKSETGRTDKSGKSVHALYVPSNTFDNGTQSPQAFDAGGPHILPNSFRFKEPLKGDKSFRYAGVWGIPAIYETPDVHFVLEFGEQIWAPIEVRNWDFIERMNSEIIYSQLWADDDIVETETGYEFSRYAQAKISADATDYASYQTSLMLATKQIISAPSYKAEFANQFRWYVRKFMPGTTMSILNTNIPGTSPAQFD